jgi:hypothetical protein
VSRIDSAAGGSVGVALSVSSDTGANAQTKHKLSSMSWLLVFIADQITGISRASGVIGEKPFVSPHLQKVKRCNARNLQSLLAYLTGHLPWVLHSASALFRVGSGTFRGCGRRSSRSVL